MARRSSRRSGSLAPRSYRSAPPPTPGLTISGAIGARTAAAIYVVSHHAVGFGQIGLAEFARVCHAHGVPVIADVASEYDLKGFLGAGADLAIYSAHKFLGGPTAGIVAGRKDLVRAAFRRTVASAAA